MITIWLILGLIAGAGYLAYAMLRGWRRELWIYATGLAVAAAIYLVFTLPTLDIAWFGIEAAGLVCYGLFAFVGWRVNPLALAAGWALHPAWDYLLHARGAGHQFVPEWYVYACISFDLLVAATIVYRVLQQRRVATA